MAMSGGIGENALVGVGAIALPGSGKRKDVRMGIGIGVCVELIDDLLADIRPTALCRWRRRR